MSNPTGLALAIFFQNLPDISMPVPWIAPRLTNGLGNRLFQIAAAIRLSRKTCRQVFFFLPRTTGKLETMFQLCPSIPILHTANAWREIEGFPTNVIQKQGIGRGLVIKGSFQDLNFFPDFNDPLLPSLPKTPEPLDQVALHIVFDGEIDLSSYYMWCIKQFLPGTTFRLFSENSLFPEKLEAVKQELEELGYKAVISEAKGAQETFLEMAACKKGFVGSNSSFAWWGAFLRWKAGKDKVNNFISHHSHSNSNLASTYGESQIQLKPYETETIALFPDMWMAPGQPNHKPNLFTTPFTQIVELEKVNEKEGKMKSFRY